MYFRLDLKFQFEMDPINTNLVTMEKTRYKGVSK